MSTWPQVMARPLALPGYPAERAARDERWSARLGHALAGWLPAPRADSRRARRLLRRVEQAAIALQPGQAAPPAALAALRGRLRRHGLDDASAAEALALVGACAAHTLGTPPYPVQTLAAWLLLHGRAVEMDTGEGKTLTAALAAAVAALAGLPTHVLSANDYLTARDAETFAPFYAALGLTVGSVVHARDTDARRSAYGADVTYATSREIVFDYLRDRLVLGRRGEILQRRVEPLFGRLGRHRRTLLQGLHFAIVDEADSVLIDEARTPLIIAGSGGAAHTEDMLAAALELAGALAAGDDFRLDHGSRHVALQARGRARIAERAATLGAAWAGRARREDLVTLALAALHLYERDRDYVVRDDRVEIVDALSGRISQGRAWERGLHQLIERKEGCPPSARRDTVARIGYPDFFRRYRHLAGMSGTLREVRGELWHEYGLGTVRVPRHRPCRREHLGTRVFGRAATRWTALAERATALVATGRAVLVGTASVAASEQAAAALAGSAVTLQVLNAKQDAAEAAIVAAAGQPGRVTIATSMAGRGTDIALEPAVLAAGGLHVVLSTHYDSARVDRQLAGRGARQGDPGSFEVMVALEDVDFRQPLAALAARLAGRERGELGGLRRQLARFALWLEQRACERRDRRARHALGRHERQQRDLLAIAGREG
ncbi:MAG: prepilin peptidase [Gammaproteobacteria bacterium]